MHGERFKLAWATLSEQGRALFEDSVERLDARTRSKLNQARNRALDEVNKGRWSLLDLGARRRPRARGDRRGVMLRGGGAPAPIRRLALEDIDIVADSDSFEMLEDVEFYVARRRDGG